LDPVIVIDTDVDLEVGARVLVNVAGEYVRCMVIADTSQVLHTGLEPAGRLVDKVNAPLADNLNVEEVLDRHPAATMPVLSERVFVDGRPGIVTNLDVPKGKVTIRVDDGTNVSVDVVDVEVSVVDDFPR